MTLASHFGFGSAMGGIYGALVPSPAKGWGWKGCLAGLVVWAGNYFVLLPLLNLLTPANKHPKERNLLMIVAHLVWGVTIAGFFAAVANDKSHGLLGRNAGPERDRT